MPFELPTLVPHYKAKTCRPGQCFLNISLYVISGLKFIANCKISSTYVYFFGGSAFRHIPAIIGKFFLTFTADGSPSIQAAKHPWETDLLPHYPRTWEKGSCSSNPLQHQRGEGIPYSDRIPWSSFARGVDQLRLHCAREENLRKRAREQPVRLNTFS